MKILKAFKRAATFLFVWYFSSKIGYGRNKFPNHSLKHLCHVLGSLISEALFPSPPFAIIPKRIKVRVSYFKKNNSIVSVVMHPNLNLGFHVS
jgi:hypothetical protein